MKIYLLLFIPLGFALADGLRVFPQDYTIAEQRDEYRSRAEYYKKRTEELERKYEPVESKEDEANRSLSHQIAIRISQMESKIGNSELTKDEINAFEFLKEQKIKIDSKINYANKTE